jgi:hypothetical protein
VLCTARSADTCTIVRGQGTPPTTALTWNAGDTFALLVSADTFNSFIQAPQLQAQATNYALDTGSANNYIIGLTPTLITRIVGAPIRVKFGHANTGICTINDGIGPAALILQPGTPNVQVPAGMIAAGAMGEILWDGAQYQLAAILNTNLYATTALVLPGASLGTGGWRKNSDGSIEQWGVASVVGGPNNVNFTRAFTIECFNVQLTPVGSNSEVIWDGPGTGTVNYFSGNFGGGTISWRAIGE